MNAQDIKTETGMLMAALENARTALALAEATIERFYASMESAPGCQHPPESLEDITGMGESPRVHCKLCDAVLDKETMKPVED